MLYLFLLTGIHSADLFVGGPLFSFNCDQSVPIQHHVKQIQERFQGKLLIM